MLKKFIRLPKLSKKTTLLTCGLVIASPLAVIATPLDFLEDLTPILSEISGVKTGDIQIGVETVGDIQGLFRKSTRGSSVDSLLGTVAGILGLPLPGENPGGRGQNGQTQTAEVVYPEDARFQHGFDEEKSSAEVQIWANTVLGEEGQQQLYDQLQKADSYREIAEGVLAQTAEQGQDSQTQVQATSTAAGDIASQASTAEGADSSQKVLKALAQQLAGRSEQDVAQSTQLSQLSSQMALGAVQQAAVAGELTVANQQLTKMQIGQAYNAKQLTNVNSALASMNEQRQREDRRTYESASRSGEMMYIPGLVE